MRTLTALFALLMFVATACGCATIPSKPNQEAVAAMLDSTVQIEVQVAGSLLVPVCDEKTKECAVLEIPVSEGWVGSGVVYDKTSGATGPIISKILTANHVLEAPAPGDLLDSPLGQVRIDAVLMVVKTRSGRTCELQPLVLGVSDTRDVATGLALCDAGRVAPIADQVPAPGASIIVTGHPQGVPVAIVTDGYVSGWMNGYLLVSAGAYGGNSGGPVWYNGEVIGLLVRGSPRYHHISLVTPLKSVLDRIAETP